LPAGFIIKTFYSGVHFGHKFNKNFSISVKQISDPDPYIGMVNLFLKTSAGGEG
jgi:hypothetical protein